MCYLSTVVNSCQQLSTLVNSCQHLSTVVNSSHCSSGSSRIASSDAKRLHCCHRRPLPLYQHRRSCCGAIAVVEVLVVLGAGVAQGVVEEVVVLGVAHFPFITLLLLLP